MIEIHAAGYGFDLQMWQGPQTIPSSQEQQPYTSARKRKWGERNGDASGAQNASKLVFEKPGHLLKAHDSDKSSRLLLKDAGEGLSDDQKEPDDREGARSTARLASYPSRLSFSNDVALGDWHQLLPIPAGGCVLQTIDYFLHKWAPEYDADYALTGYGHPHSSLVFPLAMSHAVLLESLVAMCRVFWLGAQGERWDQDTDYIKHRGRALKHIQAKLHSEDCADNATLLAIVCLTSIELLALNFNAVVAHAHGLNALVDKRRDDDDHSSISHFAKSCARAHGMLGEYVRNRERDPAAPQPSCSPGGAVSRLSYPRHPFSTDVCNVLSSLPGGFCELALSGCLSIQCICILSSLSKKLQRHARGNSSSAEQTADTQIELKALQHFYTLPKSPTEDYLVSGLICFCNQYPDRTTRNPFFNIALKCFNSALDARQKISGVWREDCLVWVTVVIAGALDICAEPLSSRHIILDSCLEDCERARDWNDLEKILRSFFWTDALGQHWKRCWEAAMNRRANKSPSNASSANGSETYSASRYSLSPPNTAHQLRTTRLNALFHESQNLTKAFIQAQV